MKTELIDQAKQLRESGKWVTYLKGSDKPCYRKGRYTPGEIVKSIGAGRAQKGEYVYIGSYRSSGMYGLYLLMNEKGKVVKHDNICYPYELHSRLVAM